MKLKELSNKERESKCEGSSGAQLQGPLGLPLPCESPRPAVDQGELLDQSPLAKGHPSQTWPGAAPCESSSLLQSPSKAWKCIGGNLRALRAEVPAGASAGALTSVRSSWLSDEEINGLSCWPGFLVADHLSRRIIYWRGSRKHTESMGIAVQAQPKGRIQGSLDTEIRQTASDCHSDGHRRSPPQQRCTSSVTISCSPRSLFHISGLLIIICPAGRKQGRGSIA